MCIRDRTEVNPLAPHYYCLDCKSSFFEDEYRAPEGTDIEEIKKIQAVIKEERAEGGLGSVSYTHLKLQQF